MPWGAGSWGAPEWGGVEGGGSVGTHGDPALLELRALAGLVGGGIPGEITESTAPLIEVLGCPVYDVYIYERGGQQIIGQIPQVTQITYNRTLCDVSHASITVAGGMGMDLTQKCIGLLADVNPWQHELGIFRNGELVWIGPITHLVYDRGQAQITVSASDLLVWMDHRLLRDNVFNAEDEPLTQTFLKVFMSGTNPDLSFRPTLAITPGTITGARQYLYLQKQMVGEIIRELGRTVLDYTVVNRTIFVCSVELNLPAVATITDEHWAIPPLIEVNGEDMGTAITVTGPGGGQYGYDEFGFAQVGSNGVDPTFGLLDRVFNEPNIIDQANLDRNASNRLALFKKPVIYTKSGRLSRYFPMDMNELIPGVKLDLRLNEFYRPILEQYRLQQLNVSVDKTKEDVEVSLIPLGAISPFDPSAFPPFATETTVVNPLTITPTAAPNGGSPNYASIVVQQSDGRA